MTDLNKPTPEELLQRYDNWDFNEDRAEILRRLNAYKDMVEKAEELYSHWDPADTCHHASWAAKQILAAGKAHRE
jgi:hypothetical protein